MIYGNMKEHKYEVEGIKPQIMTEVTTLLHTLSTVLDKIFADAASGKQEAIDVLDVITSMMLKDMGDKE